MSSNRYEAQEETRQHAHTNAVRSLAESRSAAKTTLSRAEAAGVPGTATVFDPEPPVPEDVDVDDAITRRQPPYARALRELHAATLEFWAELRPYRTRAPERWEEPLGTFPVPVEGRWESKDRGDHHLHNIVRQRGLSSEVETLSLASLGRWRFRSVTLACEDPEDPRGPPIERTEKVHLPPAVCQAAYERMNDVLGKIGLAAEVRDIEGGDRDPGRPDDVDEWQRRQAELHGHDGQVAHNDE